MKIVAALLIVLALLIGIVPQYTDCESQGRSLTLADGRQIPMKCHWTARAELGLAIPLVLLGLTMGMSRRRETLRSLSLIGAGLGAVVILLPTALIGVCGNPNMVCNSTMSPALILLGSMTIGVSLVPGVLSLVRREDLAVAQPVSTRGDAA